MITGTAPARSLDDYRRTFGDVVRSFRSLSAGQRAAIREDRLRLVEARPGEMLSAFRERTGSSWSAREIAVANQLGDGAPLRGGQLLKVAVSQPYRSRQ